MDTSPASPIIVKHHVPGVEIATVWAWVRAETFRYKALPTMDTLLSACDWLKKGGTNLYDSYKFKGFDAVEERTDMMRAIFVPNLAATKDTAVRTFETAEDSFYWPAVLTEALDFTHNEYDGTNWASGGGANQFSKWGITPKLRNAYRGLTKVEVNDYISDTPWTIDDDNPITEESLHPTRIYWDLVVNKESLPECLTPGEFTTPIVYRGTAAGTNTSDVLADAITFAATPTDDWVDHVFSDVVTFADGLYFRRTKTAIVPPNLVNVT